MTQTAKLKEELDKLRTAISSRDSQEIIKGIFKQVLEASDKFQLEVDRGFSEESDFPPEFSLQIDKVRFVQRNFFQNINSEINYELIEKICYDLEESYDKLAEIAGIF